MSSKKVTQQMANYLQYPAPIAKTLNNLSKIHSFKYKDYFTVPKLRIEWKVGDLSYILSQQQRPIFPLHAKQGYLIFFINNKRIRGYTLFDYPNAPIDDLQRLIDVILSKKLTEVINSIHCGASRDKKRAKKIIEKIFNVKVKEN